MGKYKLLLIAGLVASMLVGCQSEDENSSAVPTANVNTLTTATAEPTEEPQKLIEHEYVRDNENNKSVNSKAAYKVKLKQCSEEFKAWTSKMQEIDTNGNVLNTTFYVEENIESGYEECTYNAKGQILLKKNYYEDRKLYRTNIYEYDSYGDLVLEKTINNLNGEVTECEYKYLYSDDCMVKKTSYIGGKMSGYTEYQYDDNKRVVRESKYNSYESLEGECEYEYDDKGNVIKAIYLDGGKWLNCYMSYDENNNLLDKKIIEDDDVTNWYKYAYNNENGLIEEKELNGEAVVEDIKKITRDSKNRVIKEIYIFDGKEHTSWEEWEYVEVK